MTTARNQVTRLMALTPFLRARPEGIPLSALAAEFEVSAATMRKDLQTLVMCGLPELLPDDLVDIDLEAFEEDPEGIVRIHNADFMPRPTRLSSGEAASLLVALDSLRPERRTGTQDTINVVRAKLEAAAAEGAAGRATVVPRQPAASTGVKETIDAAISTNRQLLLSHLNATRDEVTERIVDPIGALHTRGRDYLDAWCHRSGERRLFRFDRIEAAEVQETERAHPGLAPRAADDPIFDLGGELPTARLRLHPPVRWMAEYYPILARHEAADGALEVELAVSDPRWLMRTVLAVAPHADVLGPQEYADLVAETARATLAAYDEVSPSS